MRKLAWILVMAVGLSGGSAFASEEVQKKEVYISLSEVFVPSDQKSGGEAYVVVSGMFPNSCYQWDRAEINHKSEFTHEVKAVAQVAQTMCLMVLVPFSKEVILGNLTPGEHLLRFVNGDGTFFEKRLTVQ